MYTVSYPSQDCINNLKFINDMVPEYLCELVSIRKSSQKLGPSHMVIVRLVLQPHFLK